MSQCVDPLPLSVVQVELTREVRARLAAQAGVEERRIDEVLAAILEDPSASPLASSVTGAMDEAVLEQIDVCEVGPALSTAVTTDITYELDGAITWWDRETLHAHFVAQVTFIADGEATTVAYEGTFVFHFAVMGTWAFVQGLGRRRFHLRRR